ncbi:MAG: TonB-dependent receptor [Bacteroidales bacterium]|nr:TonB-dependent receptor [Bacteroidales bacterium]
MRPIFRLIFLHLFMCFTGIVIAQPPQMNFLITGKVIESETDKPLEYVNVVVYSARDSAMVTGTISKADGSFSISVNRPGRFYLTADFIGYEKTILPEILLRPGTGSFDAGIVKIKQAVVGIDAVEVVANRPYVSYHIDKKVVEVALNPSAQGGTAVDALENVPSVQTDIEGNVSIRGSSNFTVLIDGRQSPISGSDALKQIPAASIDKIEIITNPSAKFDPDGTAGIVNIISKKGKLNGHSAVINVSAGNAPMFGGDATYTFRKDRYTITSSLGFRDGRMEMKNFEESTTFYKADSVARLTKSNIGKMQHRNYRAKLAFDYQLTKANTFTIGGEYSDFLFNRNFSSSIQRVTPLSETLNTSSVSETGSNPSSWQVIVGNRQIFNNNLEHYLTIDFTAQNSIDTDKEFLGSYQAGANQGTPYPVLTEKRSQVDETGNRYRVEANYSNPLSEKVKFEAGYTLRIDNSNQEYTRFDTLVNGRWTENPEFDDNADFSRHIHAGWALVKGEISGFSYSAGLRGESTDQSIKTKNDTFTYNYFGWYPSFALSKDIGGGHQVQANYSRRINRPRDWHLSAFPSLTDGYTLFEPNPDLKPEYASSFEVNYQKSWGQSFISAETFYRFTDDKIERIMYPINDSLTLYKMQNIHGDKNLGAELMANIKIAPWFIFNTSASYYYSIISGNYNGEDVERRGNNWRSTAVCNFTLPSKTRIQLTCNYRGPEKEIDGDEKEVYWISGAVRQEFLNRKLSASFRIDDIFSMRKNRQTNISGITTIYSERQRKSPMMFVSLTYLINQNGDKRRNGRPDDNGMGDERMDMDF